MGALEYHPAITNAHTQTADDIQVDQLVALAQAMLDQRAGLDAAMQGRVDNQDAMNAIFQAGSSAGGARPKAVIAVNQDRTRILSGQTPVPEGFNHYLLKFDGVRERASASQVFGDPRGYGRMEYAYYLMAKDAGVNMTHCELLLEGGRAHFMTQRFDRMTDVVSRWREYSERAEVDRDLSRLVQSNLRTYL